MGIVVTGSKSKQNKGVNNLEFNGIEHYDVFEGDVIIFWADVSGPPTEIQAIAQEIDGSDFDPHGFGVCVNYSFVNKEFYLVLDMDCAGASEGEERNLFYIDQGGDKHWLKTDIPQELLDRIFEECGKIVSNIEKEQAEAGVRLETPSSTAELAVPSLNTAELEKRLTAYLESSELQADIECLARDYQAQGLPVPPEEQLREEAAAEARKCLETMMICEAKGHLWKEAADPENGTSTLSCRRCGAEEHLRW